jgi:aldehyde dehydrogenase (NAD+)
MGKRVAELAARRLAGTLLELGGNNGLIVMPDADMKMVVRAVLFGAVGTRDSAARVFAGFSRIAMS